MIRSPARSPARLAAALLLASVASFTGAARSQEIAVQTTSPEPARQTLPVDLYEARTVRVNHGDKTIDFGYRLLHPDRSAPAGGSDRYPLVLFLHGAGERGQDNVAQLKYLPAWMTEPALRQRHPCFVLAPQCRMDERWVDEIGRAHV